MPARPPGPRLPRALQTAAFMSGGNWWIQWCRWRYGDVVFFNTLFARFVMVFAPEHVERVMKAPPDQLRAGEANAPLAGLLGDRSVLVLDGADHIRHRKLLLPPFHGQRLRTHERMMRQAADRAIDSWPVGPELSLLDEMFALTLGIVSRVVIDIEDDERRREFEASVRSVLTPMQVSLRAMARQLANRGAASQEALRAIAGRRRVLDEVVLAEIRRRRDADPAEGLEDSLALLLAARDDDGRGLTDTELRDEVVTLLVAGHETTATGLAWAFDLLLRRPRELARARLAAESGDTAYLDAVVKEALRIRPVVPGFGRVVRGEPFDVGGHSVPVGSVINPSVRALHRRRDVYPQPGAFRPERFLGPDAPDNYSWVPFGGGTRRCLGANFALLEMRVVLTQVLLRCELRPVGRRERPQRRMVTIVPKRGVRAVQSRPPAPAPRELPEPERVAA